jgi:hypothetical protein
MSSHKYSTDFSLILASVEKTAKEAQANSQHSDQRTHLKYLLESLPETGLDFDIGGNVCHFLGKGEIDRWQTYFHDIPELQNAEAVVFVVQQDFNPIAVLQAGNGRVLGGLAGGPLASFGRSLTEFLRCLRVCAETRGRSGMERARPDDGSSRGVEHVLLDFPEVNHEGWMEYFCG